jgi:hypothetical protein
MRPCRPVAAATFLALLASCALVRPARVSSDGREVQVGGERWVARDGITLFERDGELHVVCVGPEATFDVAVPTAADGRLAWPRDAPFEASEGQVRLRGRGGSGLAALVESRQLHPHADHFHLTSRYPNPDWQALYLLREDGSGLDPARQQLAASVLAELLDQRIPGTSEEVTLASLRRVDSVIARVRRAVQSGQPGPRVLGILTHDFEITGEGRVLEIEGQRFRAGDGVRFAYDGGHFHVESTGGAWVQVVPLEGMEPGSFELPHSLFYEVRDGVVEARPVSTRWQGLAATHQVRFVRDHWHLTETYLPLRPLLAAAEDPALPAPLQERARGRALEVLRVRLDVGSEPELESWLATMDRLIERQVAETARERPAAGP